MLSETAIAHLPDRRGSRPRTSGPAPHQQVSQNAPPRLQAELFRRVLHLPNVEEDTSDISVDGARAFVISGGRALGPKDAFMIGGEFAHLHPEYDGSLHLRLPPANAETVVAKG